MEIRLRFLYAVATAFMLVSMCIAQSGDWSAVQALAPGEQIKVAVQNGSFLRGRFQSASDRGLVVSVGDGQETIVRESIRNVAVRGKSHRGRNALVGAAIGAGAGLGMGVAIDSCSKSTSLCTTGNKGKAILTPAIAAIGAAIGAALPSGGWHKVYAK